MRMQLLLSIWTLIRLQTAASDSVSFNRDVRAILSDRCFQLAMSHATISRKLEAFATGTSNAYLSNDLKILLYD